MNKSLVYLFDVVGLFFVVFSIISFTYGAMYALSFIKNPPNFKYKDKVVVVDGFYNGESGYISQYMEGVYRYKYAVKTEDNNLLFIDEKDLKREDK